MLWGIWNGRIRGSYKKRGERFSKERRQFQFFFFYFEIWVRFYGLFPFYQEESAEKKKRQSSWSVNFGVLESL